MNVNKQLSLIEAIVLAYTVKTSVSDTPEKFLEDYQKNLEIFKQLLKSDSTRKWIY